MSFGVCKWGAAFRLLLIIWGFVSMSLWVKAADDSNPITDFFSYLPAPPQIKLPKIEIVPFWTDDLKRARKAYADGDYEQARVYFIKSSEDGNIVADWYLGHIYRLGRGVNVDKAVAYSYFSRVADNFNSDEHDPNRLRIMIDAVLRVADYQRVGIPSANLIAAPETAMRTYLRMASSFGHPHALYALGVMNIEGQGTKRNPQQGLKWLNAAVRKHSPEAAAYLGDLYDAGKVVPQDETRALMYYMVAARTAQPDENPAIFSRLEALKGRLQEDQRLEAEARARIWKEENPGTP